MLRELTENEMEMVSGGAETVDQVVVEAQRQSRELAEFTPRHGGGGSAPSSNSTFGAPGGTIIMTECGPIHNTATNPSGCPGGPSSAPPTNTPNRQDMNPDTSVPIPVNDGSMPVPATIINHLQDSIIKTIDGPIIVA